MRRRLFTRKLRRAATGRAPPTESKDDPDSITDARALGAGIRVGRVGPTAGSTRGPSHFPTGLSWHHTRHMSSLWTPYGEQPVEPERPGAGAPGAGQPPGGGPPPGPDDLGEDIDPEQMREMLARLAATPVEMIVAQFAVQLQEIAVLHLGIAGERSESLGQAALAIDALGTLVEGLAERLAPNDEPLRQVLSQLRLAFVEVTNELAGGATPPG